MKFGNIGGLFDILNENFIFVTIHIISLTFLGYIVHSMYQYLPLQIPLFYTLPWGEKQLASRELIFALYYITILISFINIIFVFIQSKNGQFVIAKFSNYLSLIILFFAFVFIYRIINISALTIFAVPMIFKLVVLPFGASLVCAYLIGPYIIKFAKKFGLMDDPLTHKHPGMLIKKPTPRAGGLVYMLAILIPGIFFLPILESQKLIGILVGMSICVITGLFDDKKDIHPIFRLFIQGLIILITVLSGIILIYIPNPFGNPIMLDGYKFTFEFLGPHSVYYFSVLVAAFWIGTTMNFMSFANGTDGVYAGLVFVASFVIAVIMYQTIDVDPEMAKFIKLAALSSGAAFGMAFFTWPPQKMLWGFGATGAGLIIAALAIIGSTKVAVMLLVLLIPFMDGTVAVLRRLKRKQLPFWGDREHLHHKLLFTLGWNKSKVATFYWLTTLSLGIIGIISSGRSRALWVVSMSVIFIMGVALLNLIRKPKSN